LSFDISDPTAGLERSEAVAALELLARRLAASNTEVEFYFLGGAVLYQAFAGRPGTARVTAMYRPAEAVQQAATEVAETVGLSEGWMHRAVRSALADGAGQGEYLEIPNLRAFVARPEYVLAMKCGAMRLGDEFQEVEDVRYVLRSMNVTSADEALTLVSRYFTERQLPADVRQQLEALTHR